MSKLRIAVMGCANIAKRSMIPAIKNVDELDLIAVASRDLAKAEEVAREFECSAEEGYEKLLLRDDVDAVYIPLPTGLHHEWIIRCLESGKHVLAEKSLAMNLSSAEEMCNLAQQKNLVLMEDFMFQYHAQHKLIKELIEAGEIGDVRLFRCSFGFPSLPLDNFRYNAVLGGGALLDCGAYMLKSSSFFTGEDLKLTSSQMVFDRKLNIDLHGSASLLSSSGLVCQTAWGFGQYYQCKYEIWGTDGMITAPRALTPPPDFNPLIILEKQGVRDEIKADADNHFENILKCFLQNCINRKGADELRKNLEQARLLEEVRKTAVCYYV